MAYGDYFDLTFNEYGFQDHDGLYIFSDYHIFTQYRPDLDLVFKVKDRKVLLDSLDMVPNFYHANQYVFFGSPASFTWLKLNDKPFLFQLVRTYGYVKDKELLKWVLDNTEHKKDWLRERVNNFLAFSGILTHRDYEGQLHFNSEVLELYDESPDDYWLANVSEYLDYIAYEGSYEGCMIPDEGYEQFSENRALIFWTFAEQAEVVARLLYWTDLHMQDHEKTNMAAFYMVARNRDEYDAEFKRKNYYGIEGFEELWERAKISGQGTSELTVD
ncbi:hypothetical protein [Coprobacter tertius]|uniref:Uncharacterized protein n=1 Tax=Coprobacter tertius TaxID=2944915 RepID=A0ABT1MH32_9BACT|nr:hypothetical protein [Coprobacter tertius]MCP9611171.1 hypothetical protein [Coprobacter tertius]